MKQIILWPADDIPQHLRPQMGPLPLSRTGVQRKVTGKYYETLRDQLCNGRRPVADFTHCTLCALWQASPHPLWRLAFLTGKCGMLVVGSSIPSCCCISVTRRGPRGSCPPIRSIAYPVILWFEKRCSKKILLLA